MGLNDTGGYTIDPGNKPLPQVPAGPPGGAPPNAGGKPFDPNDPSTWPPGFSFGNNTATGDPNKVVQDPQSAYNYSADWGLSQSGTKPWMNKYQEAADTRNNFYYGGSAGGADAFNGQLYQVGQGLGMGFGRVENNANGLQSTAQGLQNTVNGRNPGQFLDQGSIQNNGVDRGSQQAAIGSLFGLANGPQGPSAAQATLANATNANQANELALARSGRGMGGSQAGLQQAIAQGAGIQQQSANQAAILNAQEQQQIQQNRLNAYGAIGNIAGQARTGDVQQGSYVTGSQQNALNANDQTALGYGGQALGAGNLALGANQGNTSAQIGIYGLQNDVNKSQLNANQNYEQGLQNFYLGRTTGQQAHGTDYSPYLAAAGAVLGAAVGGPGGAVAGGAAGGAAGKAVS